MEILNEFEINSFSQVYSDELSKSSWRFDAKFYVYFKDILKVNLDANNSKPLKKCCDDIYEVPPFVHIYVNKKNGIPFYTSSGLFNVDMNPSHYLSYNTKKLDT